MVLAEVTTTWNRALVRAEARSLKARQVNTETHGAVTVMFYRVKSWSRDGIDHGVKVTASSSGIEVTCSCEGGLNGRPCQHAAAVLKLEGWLGEQPKPATRRPAKPKRTGLLAWQDEDEADARAAWGEPFADLILPE